MTNKEQIKFVTDTTNEIIQLIIDRMPEDISKTTLGISLAYDCIANAMVRFMKAYGITEEDILNSLEKANAILSKMENEQQEN